MRIICSLSLVIIVFSVITCSPPESAEKLETPIRTIELSYQNRIIIGNDPVSTQFVVEKIILPDSLKREVYIDGRLDNLVISTSENSWFVKFDAEGNAVSVNQIEPEPIRIFPNDYIDESFTYSHKDTIIDGNIYSFGYNDTTASGYLINLQTGYTTTVISPNRYGEMTTSFSEFRQIENVAFPFTIVQDIPASGYTKEMIYERIRPNSIISADEFQLKSEWVSWKKGDQIPSFEVVNLSSGQTFGNKDILNKVTLIDFWATWCKPCIEEFPDMQTLYTTYKADGFEILGISLDEDTSRLSAFLQKKNLPWIIASDSGGFKSTVARIFKVATLPKPILVDTTGRIIAMDTDIRGDNLRKKLEEIFGRK